MAKQRKDGSSTLDEGIRTEERSQSVSLKTTDEYLKEKEVEATEDRRRSAGRIFGQRDRDWKAVEYSRNIPRRNGRERGSTGWLGIFWGLDGFITGYYD